MTEVSFEAPAAPGPGPDAAERPRRGRPRPLVTLERDDRVAAALAERESWSRRELAEHLSWEGKVVYACLNRLRRTGRAEKVAGSRYRALPAAAA